MAFGVGVLVVLVACSSTSTDAAAPLPEHLVDHPAFAGSAFPISVGHGGAKQLCPENTLECYQMALDAGASALEADLQVLADGTLLMFHDDNALEQTGTDLELRLATLNEVRGLDMGFAFSPDDGVTFPYRSMGISPSTLSEFLAAFPGVPVLLDVKPESAEMEEALVRFVEDELTDADRERLYIKSNDAMTPDRLRALEPPPRVALSGNERTQLVVALLTDEVPALDDVGPSWVDLNPNDVPQFDTVIGLVSAWTRAEGHVLTASTINDPDQMQTLLDAGDVDGLVTDRPDLQATLTP